MPRHRDVEGRHGGGQRDEREREPQGEVFEHAVGAQMQLVSSGQTGGSQVGQDAVEIASTLESAPA